MLRKLGIALAFMLVLGLVTGVQPTTIGVEPAGAEPRSASCTEAGVTWRVDYTYTVNPYYGPLVEIDALKRITSAGETDAGSQTWQVRRDSFPHEWAPNTPEASVVPFKQIQGSLSSFNNELWSVFVSPRLVTPDGSCTIYLSPFSDIQPSSSAKGPKVAVLGDDLVTQLNDSAANDQGDWQGYVEGELNALGIQAEVEGQGPPFGGTTILGRRWTDNGESNPLAKADSYLADEFRGLLEHDVDGFVMALGLNDARYIAAGDREARKNEIYTKLTTLAWEEMRTRTSCMVVVTTPENGSNIDPDYAWAALQVNNFFRWFAAVGGPNDSLEVVDFALDAKNHLFGEPDAWFVDDNVHLNADGRTAYTDAIGQAARRCADEVVVYGAQDSFDGGALIGQNRIASGHSVTQRAVDGWNVLPGRGWWFPTVLSDGTMLSANIGQRFNPFIYTGNTMAISAFQPATDDFYTIQIPTDTGSLTRNALGGEPMGFEIGDLKAIDDDTVVFSGASVYGDLYEDDGIIQPDPAQGMFPSIGVLTKGEDNRWQVASQWSPRELYDAASDPVLADRMCPLFWPSAEPRTIRDCLSVQQVEVLPRSGHVVVTHYLGRRGRLSGNITVLELSENTSGAFDVDIEEVFEFPEIPDPNSATGQKMAIAPLELDTDPTSAVNDERFALKFDAFPPAGSPYGVGIGMVEFSYDASATAGKIEAVSPPVYMGKVADAQGVEHLTGANMPLYDNDGNLWIPGSGLFIYAKTSAGRRLSNGSCMPPGITNPLDPSLVVTLAGNTSLPKAWGVVCPPDFEVLQGRHIKQYLVAAEEDPATGNMISVDRFGGMYAIDPDGAGTNMTFRTSNGAMVPTHAIGDPIDGTWPCPTPEDPDRRCSSADRRWMEAFPGGVDASGRAWVVVNQAEPNIPPGFEPPVAVGPMETREKWVYSVDLTRLWGRQAHQLSARPGGSTIVQAERSQTIETTQRPGQIATTDVVSKVTVIGCFDYAPWLGTCANPWDPSISIRGGLALGDNSGGGVPAGTVAKYRIVVPKGGSYQVTYRATDLNDAPPNDVVTDERIQLTVVNGGTYGPTSIDRTWFMHDQLGPTITLGAGTHEIEVLAPTAHHDWQLDWIKFVRQ